jgi:hypothetical protein
MNCCRQVVGILYLLAGGWFAFVAIAKGMYCEREVVSRGCAEYITHAGEIRSLGISSGNAGSALVNAAKT